MPKQTKSSNNAALKGFALTLVILILAVCVMAAMTEGFTNWNPYGWFDKEPAVEQQPDGEETGEESAPIEATITNSEHVMLAMSAAVHCGGRRIRRADSDRNGHTFNRRGIGC